MLPLFDSAQPELRQKLSASLGELARQSVWIGTSSWKYEGWMGQIYTPERYYVRGRFSKKKFEAECLNEYAETFPTVCGDFAFYQFPSPEFWRKLFHSAPGSLRYAFKTPEEVTVRKFPSHQRYGPRAGLENPTYLDASLFDTAFLEPLRPYRAQVPVIILEFGTFSKSAYPNVDMFVKDLDAFLAKLPQDFRYAVEVRNMDYLRPPYFACLRERGVAHVFNGWTRMPEIHRQMAIEEAYTSDLVVARALLRFGRPYEKAVQMFSPYQAIQDANPKTREALKALVARAKRGRQETYIYVNNRLEGNAPLTIEAILD